jgi:hypothetical protein
MPTATIDDIHSLLLGSRKFVDWKPRVRHHDGRSRAFGENVRNSSEPGTLKPVKSVVDERHYSPTELAKTWGVDVETIRNLFRNEPGVMKIGDKNPKHKRPYLTLRIPESVALRLHRRLAE